MGSPWAGPEKYREHGNGVPWKADCWQEGRSLYHEESGRKVVFYAIEGEKVGKVFNYGIFAPFANCH